MCNSYKYNIQDKKITKTYYKADDKETFNKTIINNIEGLRKIEENVALIRTPHFNVEREDVEISPEALDTLKTIMTNNKCKYRIKKCKTATGYINNCYIKTPYTCPNGKKHDSLGGMIYVGKRDPETKK